MLKRLAARGKQPPAPVSPVVTQGADHFDLSEQNNISPVSPGSVFVVTVYTLDDEQKPLEISVQKDSDGQWLFDEACEQLGGIQEKDYFGLRFIDREKQRQWVDTTRNIYRQLKHMHPCCVSFRVKHYPPSPLEDLKQEISRYFLFLQIKRDILHSRLLCQGNEAYELAAYIAQIDLGDHDDMEDPETYLNDYKILPNQSPKSETKIAEIHKTLKGLVPSEAESKFLTLASKMETYGIDPYSVKDQKGNVLYLGLTHVGVVTFQGSRRAHIFKWSDITKFNYDGKLFIIHVTFREDNQFKRKKKHILGFKCESQVAALSLWRWAVDRYCFFTLKRSSEAKRSKSGGGIFRRSHTFRFSGRCQREALSNSLSLLTLPQPSFARRYSDDADDDTVQRASSFRRDEQLKPLTVETDRFATFPRTRKQDEADQVLTAATTESPVDEQGATARIVESPPMEVVEERDEDDGRQDMKQNDAALPEAQDESVIDGEVVETIVVPTMMANQHAANPCSSNQERGVDVGDIVDVHLTPEAPVESTEESQVPVMSHEEAGDVPLKAQPNFVSNHVSVVPSGKSRSSWKICFSSLLISLLVSVGALVFLFEVGPQSETVRPLTENSVFAGWRQQWYLPLRNVFLPTKY